jgi:hypothetical protein
VKERKGRGRGMQIVGGKDNDTNEKGRNEEYLVRKIHKR